PDGPGGGTRPGGLEKITPTRWAVTRAHGDRRRGVGSDRLSSRDGESVWDGAPGKGYDRCERIERGGSFHRLRSPQYRRHHEQRGSAAGTRRRGNRFFDGSIPSIMSRGVTYLVRPSIFW